MLGGIAHSAGITRLYVWDGVPDLNRVLLDVWIAEAQLLGGGLHLVAAARFRSGREWRALAAFGALTVIGYAIVFLPVLLLRAP